ncbi:hypothetical protein BDP27DRAFT_1318445 [Rhodocollybia butyracea]|uniref:Uncharacterized protein n=1 Tax=Rhodocollybia butyracea TaxID=206335 RepID=A0A9P5PW22_9AGAR|nr:hypothetical protein BDP27DRAFT_1318445 [Rhodocollybia butyracea]
MIWPENSISTPKAQTIVRAHRYLNFPDWNSVDTEETLPFRKELEEKLILVEECALKLERGNFIDKYYCKGSFEQKVDALSAASYAYSTSMEASGRPIRAPIPCSHCVSKLHDLGLKICGCAQPPPEPKVKPLFHPCRKGCPVLGDWVLKLTIAHWAQRNLDRHFLANLMAEQEKYGWRGSEGRDDSVNEHALTKLGYFLPKIPSPDQLLCFA